MNRQPSNSSTEIRITRLERRLRALQETFADRSEEERRGHLVEEVLAVLEEVPHEERTPFLRAVKGRFPAFDSHAANGAINPAEHEKTSSNSSLAAAHAAASPIASTHVSDAASNALCGATQQSVAAVRQALRLKDDDPIDSDRLYQLTALLIDMVGTLDRVAGELAPASAGGANHRPLQSAMNRCIQGRPEFPTERMKESLHDVTRRVGFLIKMIPAIGDFAQEEHDRIAPEKVERLVGATWTQSLEHRCWVHYRQHLAPHLVNGGFKRRIDERIKQEIEKIQSAMRR